MKQIVLFVTNINICYLILNILLLISINLYLKQRNIKKSKRRILLFCVLIVNILAFSYFNNIFQNIFSLKYLSAKSYLIILATTNIITLITINKKVKLIHAVLNYTLFILMFMIFGIILFIILGNKIPQIYFMDIKNIVRLIDLSFVVFIIYFILSIITYIGYCVFSDFKIKDIKIKVISKFKKNKVTNRKENIAVILSEEELLNYKDKNNFYINKVDCGIIFEDSNPNNIIKNYHILLNNIEATMVNGFTLKENKLLKSICAKLDIYNLNDIDIYNLSILNRISVEEYNLLKKINNIN